LQFDEVVDALRSATSRSGHRMQLRQRRVGLLVVDDAYNANPASVAAALEALVGLGRARRGRTWAVLGEMLELGPTSLQLHESTGAEAARVGVDEVVAVGAGAPIAAGTRGVDGWHGRARTVDDAEQAVHLLRREAHADDVVLVKASNSVELWRVADALLADARAEASA
jgi:UDP-N-acetylmuramoyl-tripeptide--D-alanyl-D-alanine ligase